ncbi:alpha/beta-hydrolase [Panus rudis PR-1116 ss-1]|nr:alpha/beta-hydrolase [Panus rudis PR-1116 ss-1]
MSEQPFTLHVPDSALEFLQKKLELTRLPDEIDGAGWDYGVPLSDIKRLVARWKNGYDWRASEKAINELPQFTRDIEVEGHGTLNIHYVHKKSEVENAIPLLFVHGWPGHFMEASKIIPILTKGGSDQPSFHLVVFSLPGYGFSDAPKKPGFALHQYAEVGHKLMLALGYHEYVTQGGDWGHLITREMQRLYGNTYIKAWHTNIVFVGPPQFTKAPLKYLQHLVTPYRKRDKDGLARTQWFQTVSSGYLAEQSTKPQTLGYSLSDSPVGLLAWIYEKLVEWTDGYKWTDDEVLTWVSIYWFSKAGPTASTRIYYEALRSGDFNVYASWTNVPCGISYFPKDVVQAPKLWPRALGNIVFEHEHDVGGHFAAYEEPGLLAADLRKMFGNGGPAFGVVSGKNGYNTL